MRFCLLVLVVSGALLPAAFLVAAESHTAAALQQTVTVTMGAATGPAGGGSQTGTVTLTAMASQTEAVLNIETSADGMEVEQPVHIHAGTCAELGAIRHSLTNVVDGVSTTTVDTSLDSLLIGKFAINVHKSEPEIGVYVSCGNIPAAAAAVPSAGGAPPASGDGASAWSYLLIAAGSLALLGCSTLALGLRRQR